LVVVGARRNDQNSRRKKCFLLLSPTPPLRALLVNAAHACQGALARKGSMVEAEAMFREALEGKAAVLGERHAATLNALYNLGVRPF
jgi:hypothetical protein